MGEAHLAGGVGMPPPDPAAFAARRLSPPSPAAIELEGGDGGAPSAADERRTREYLQAWTASTPRRWRLRTKSRRLIALRGRIDELISFAQGRGSADGADGRALPPFAVEDAAGTVLGSFAGTLHGGRRRGRRRLRRGRPCHERADVGVAARPALGKAIAPRMRPPPIIRREHTRPPGQSRIRPTEKARGGTERESDQRCKDAGTETTAV